MKKSASSSWLKWALLLAVAAGAYAVFRYARDPAAAAVEYRTAVVERGDLVQAVTANGSLNPVRNVEVGSQISGTILDIKVDFNSRVKEGDVIAQIDPATYERALVQAQAELANAEAALELAQLTFNRAEELFANSLISRSEYDQAKVSLSQAQATVRTRQANVERAEVDLSRTTIYAPIDGVVISRKVEVGQTVAASLNTPTLFVIANDLTRMQIEAAVSEADVGGVEDGQKVRFRVDAFPTRQFEGEVRQVRFEPLTNQNVVNYTTVVDVANPDLKLRPGMTANADIITQEKRNVLKIPNGALRFRPPAGAVVVGETNATAGASGARPGTASQELATSGPFAGLPVPPWSAERRRPTEEERSRYEASLTEAQRQQYQEAMQRMRARMAEGGGGGGGGAGMGAGGGARRSAPMAEGPRTQTLYVLESGADGAGGKARKAPVLRAVKVTLGITDGVSTEVVDGLKEGDVVALMALTETPAGGGAAMGSPFGGPTRMR